MPALLADCVQCSACCAAAAAAIGQPCSVAGTGTRAEGEELSEHMLLVSCNASAQPQQLWEAAAVDGEGSSGGR